MLDGRVPEHVNAGERTDGRKRKTPCEPVTDESIVMITKPLELNKKDMDKTKTKSYGHWQNKENCINEAKKYKTRGEFATKAGSAYNQCLKESWLDEVCEHMQTRLYGKDLQTMFPKVAEESYGWDPKEVSYSSHKKKEWKCNQGHIYVAAPSQRTRQKPTGCPYCSNKLILKGYNDLLTLFPKVAEEAYGWDPTEYGAGGLTRMKWKCKEGHIFEGRIGARATGGKDGSSTKCPYCAGQKVIIGVNDILKLFPEIAKEAYGWDPSKVSPGTKSNKKWRCSLGHIYESRVFHRTRNQTECPICKGKKILIGYNDLSTTHPKIAEEAYEWDPTTTSQGRNDKVRWKCKEGHIYEATINSRTGGEVNKGSGCPFCAENGYNPSKDAWFYLMERPGEFQIGITNDIKTRAKRHERDGWIMLDKRGPTSGEEILKFETELKRWIKENIGTIEGKRENWESSKLSVSTLKELQTLTGITSNIMMSEEGDQ